MLSHPDILACRHLDEDNGHCGRSKSRKGERRWSREEDDARQMEKTDFSEREKSYEENGRKTTSLGELEDGGRYEKWRDEALAKTNFSPVAFLMEEMEVEEEEEMEKEEEERRKKRRILDRERESERKEKRLKTEKLRFRDDFRRHYEDDIDREGRRRKSGEKGGRRSWGGEEKPQKRRSIKIR